MKFKEFLKWCNERACDGMWGIQHAAYFTLVIKIVKRKPFWSREKEWQRICEEDDILKMISILDEQRQQVLDTAKELTSKEEN